MSKWTDDIDHFNPYKEVPKSMRELGHWTPTTSLAHRALAGHEMFGLKDHPMTPRHKVFIAIAYAYADGRLVEKDVEE
jgi:hypothetical protein